VTLLDKKDEAMKEGNANLLSELSKSFYVEPCGLGKDPKPIIAKAIEKQKGIAGNPDKNGVLMVMMENYTTESLQFLPNGKLAIGIKYTKDSMDIVQHLSSLGFVLFHHRNDNDQHLFRIENECSVISPDQVDEDRYRHLIKDIEIYLCVDIDSTKELDSSQIHCSKKPYEKTTRYDAQYASIEELS
jgi:hypothetical protein